VLWRFTFILLAFESDSGLGGVFALLFLASRADALGRPKANVGARRRRHSSGQEFDGRGAFIEWVFANSPAF